MELWTGALSWPDLNSVGLFWPNLFLNSLKNINIVTLNLTLWPINSGLMTSLLLPHLSSSLTDSLSPWISYATKKKMMLNSCKMVEKQSEAFHRFLWHFFPSLKQNFIAYGSSKVSSRPNCIFEIHQLWQSGFSRVYSNCCCSCSFEPEIIKNGQSSYKMYSNNIVIFQESTVNFKCQYEKSLETYRMHLVYEI